MTFAPEAQFDPNALEAAVSEVDFTPTGVTVWLRGTVNQDDLPAVGDGEVTAWLVAADSGQRFLLLAGDEGGKAAIDAAGSAPPGSMVLYGQATRSDDTAPVTVRVQGIAEDE